MIQRPWKRTLRRQRGIVQFRLGQDDHPPLSRELEVGRHPSDVDFAEQLSRRVVHLHPVATSNIDVALGVDMDSIRDSRRHKRKGPAAFQGAILIDVVAVAIARLVSIF